MLRRLTRCRTRSSNSRPMTAATLRFADRLRLQPSHSPTDEGLNLLGKPEHWIGHRLASVGQARVGQQDPDHLADEQRVAGGDVVHPGDHRFGGSVSGHLADVGAHLRAAEPPQRDPVAYPCQLGEQLGQLVDALLGLPVCAKQHDAPARDRLSEESQQQQRRRIRRVQVVKDHEQPTVVRGRHQQPGYPIEQRKPVAVGVGGRRRLKRLGGPRPAAGVRRGRDAFLELAAGRSDDLDPGPVGGGAAMLPASAREHPPALVGKQAANSSISRDLPMPGSPVTRNRPPGEQTPPPARQRVPPSSRRRPTKGRAGSLVSAAAKPATAGRLTLLASAIRKV